MQRVQKVLADLGLGSRREIESWIVAGLVKVNGETAVLGTKVAPDDKITVSGRVIPAVITEEHQLIMYHKPEGQICTRNDPEGRRTVFEYLPKLQTQRWVSVGRLDINSSGLLLFTTDGDLANVLMHPKANIEREYAVRVLGTVNDTMIKKMLRGVTLDDGTTAKFTKVVEAGGSGANTWYNVTLNQGRYREVRRIWEAMGIRVSRLIRIRYGPFDLPRTLAEGDYIQLNYAKYKRELMVPPTN